MAGPLLEVGLFPYVPHTSGDDPMPVKRELRDAILKRTGRIAVEEARERLRGKRLMVQVVFALWEGRPDLPDTRAKKDLDNLLKPLLDTLQGQLEVGGKEVGLGLIP